MHMCTIKHKTSHTQSKSTDDPLWFWQVNGSRYPLLAPVARFVLAIPATSVPSERLFSTAGLVMDRLCASMAPDMVQKILFLNKFKRC